MQRAMEEQKDKPYKRIVDLTNIPNEFQESMRFGILDLDLLIEAIKGDLKNLDKLAKINMVFSCFDQIDDNVKFRFNGIDTTVSKQLFLNEMRKILMDNIEELDNIYITQGDSRKDLMKID